jgi:nitrite reductase/ring-hydroxylating ferredoxin subunit
MVSQVTDDNVCAALCRLDEIADGGVLEVEARLAGAEPESLLLLRAGSQVRGFLNICPHAGRPLNWAPGRFLLEGGMLVCAAHGATFSIPDGYCVLGPCRGSSLREVAIALRGDEVRLAAQ